MLSDIMKSIRRLDYNKYQEYNTHNIINPAITYGAYKKRAVKRDVEIHNEGAKIDISIKSKELSRVLLSDNEDSDDNNFEKVRNNEIYISDKNQI
jgi:hypothetical protein